MADPLDDDKWIDVLAGRPSANVTPDTAREAEMLRRVMRAREQAEQEALDAAPASEERGLHALLFRLRRERLLERTLLRRLSVPLAVAAAVALMILVVRPGMFFPERVYYDEPPAFRGPVAQQSIASERPKEEAESLAQSLKAQGIAARLYQKERSYMVDFNLRGDEPQKLRDLLGRFGATAQSGDNRLVFTPR